MAIPPANSNGTRQNSRRLKTLGALALTLSVLAGCQTTGTGVTSKAAQCEAFRKILWSRNDTKPTVAQVREHNAAGRLLGCWA